MQFPSLLRGFSEVCDVLSQNFVAQKSRNSSLLSAAPAKSGPLDFPSQKRFLLFFAHEKGLGHMFQK